MMDGIRQGGGGVGNLGGAAALRVVAPLPMQLRIQVLVQPGGPALRVNFLVYGRVAHLALGRKPHFGHRPHAGPGKQVARHRIGLNLNGAAQHGGACFGGLGGARPGLKQAAQKQPRRK